MHGTKYVLVQKWNTKLITFTLTFITTLTNRFQLIIHLHSDSVPAEKSVKTRSEISISDWSIIMIGLGCLLAISSYLLFKFQFDGWGCKKSR
jgi:archaellum biogenesis protein FlaJ (TadC family)